MGKHAVHSTYFYHYLFVHPNQHIKCNDYTNKVDLNFPYRLELFSNNVAEHAVLASRIFKGANAAS